MNPPRHGDAKPKRTKRPLKGELAKDRVRSAFVDHECLKLRRAGATFEAIAAQVGVSREGARKAVMRSLTRLKAENRAQTEELRELECARLDALQTALWNRAMSPTDKGQLGAVDRVVSIIDQRCRLLGLHAPKQLELSGTGGGPIEVVDYVTEMTKRLDAMGVPTPTSAAESERTLDVPAE